MCNHAERIRELLAAGEAAAAKDVHNAHVDAEFDRARQGATINLSDLMAGKEELGIDATERDGAA